MSVEWALQVSKPNGESRTWLNMDSSILSLNRFDVDRVGNCLEAEFTGVPAELGVSARDIVTLHVKRAEDQIAWAMYSGMLVLAGSRRSKDPRRFKAVGLKQRLYEIPVTHPVIPGGDVAGMARFAATLLFEHQMGFSPIVLAPNLGFQLGDRYPQLESVGELFDALAETCGAFIVPPGETYTYNGRTWAAGELVPAVQWGVGAYREVIFRRPTTDALPLNEDSPNVLIDWSDTVAEDVADRVTLVYASEYPQGAEHIETRTIGFDRRVEGIIPQPLSYTPPASGTYRAHKRVSLDHPVDFMRDMAPAAGKTTIGTWLNSSRAFDKNPATYATLDSTSGHIRINLPSAYLGGIIRVRFAAPAATDPHLTILGSWSASSDIFAPRTLVWALLGVGAANEAVEAWIPLPAPAAIVGSAEANGFVEFGSHTNGTRLHLFEIYVPDEAVAARVARGHYRLPQADASVVRVVGDLALYEGVHEVLLTPVGEAARTVPVERTEVSITAEGGLVTAFHLAQAYNPELLSQRVVLERLSERQIRRAT